MQCALVILPCLYVSSRHSVAMDALGGELRSVAAEAQFANTSTPEQKVRDMKNGRCA